MRTYAERTRRKVPVGGIQMTMTGAKYYGHLCPKRGLFRIFTTYQCMCLASAASVLHQCSAMTQADTLTKAVMWRGCRLVRRPDSTPLVPVTLFHSLTLACPIFLLCERKSGTWKKNKQRENKNLDIDQRGPHVPSRS